MATITLDTTTPAVRVTFPNGGERFQAGQTVTIQWSSTDNVGVAAHDILFSATGDAPFTAIVSNLPGSQMSYSWTVPNTLTTQGVIRVVARDAAGNQAGDRSDAVFTIAQASDTVLPTVRVISPNGGERYTPGQAVLIQWTSSDNVAVVAHDVLFSATGDAPFTAIVSNLPGSQMSYSWTVPNTLTTQGVIRVVARDAAGNQTGDRSDAVFTIAQPADTVLPTVRVISPNGGERYTPGQAVLIQWTSSDNVGVVAHDVLFSATGAEPFTAIATNLSGTQATFSWTVPNTLTTQGAIRVVARDAAGNQGGDKSDAVFTIAQAADTVLPTVRVISPNGGERYTPGQAVLIQWTSSDNVGVVAHDVLFSATGAEPFTAIVSNLPGSQMSYSWTVPNTLTTQGAIRVVARDAAGNQAGDKSDAAFTIQMGVAAPLITEVSPPAGPASRNGGPAQVVKVNGMSFQTGARVFFAMIEARVTAFSATSLSVEVPESSQTGPVTVKVINPDGQESHKDSAFTYLSAQKVDRARIFTVRPLTVLENADTNFEITGRNLATAFAQGSVVFRVPRGVTVTMKTAVTITPDPVAQQDKLTFRASVNTPAPLDPLDRLVLTVAASVRPGSATDHVHETSRSTFTVVGATSPIPIAFSAKVKKGGPNVVVLAGRGLATADVSIEHTLGDLVQVSKQPADDELAGFLVTIPPDAPDGSLSLVLKNRSGSEIGRYPLGIQLATVTTALAPTDPERDPRVATLAQVPGQRVRSAAAGNFQVFDLGRKTLTDGAPNLDPKTNKNLDPGIKINERDVSSTIPIVDLVRLFPLFDEGGAAIDESVFTGTVGAVLGLRALSLTLVVQVVLQITQHVGVFVDVDPFLDVDFNDPFNEFEGDLPELPGAFGALVFFVREEITVSLQIFFYVAVVLPNATFSFLASFGLNLPITDNGRRLALGLGRSVRVEVGRFGPAAVRPELSNQLRLINTDAKPDALGLGVYGYYFPTAPGKVCIDFDFNMRLFEQSATGVEALVFELFRPAVCFKVREGTPKTYRIVPGPFSVARGAMQQVQLLAQQRDQAGNPVGSEMPVPAAQVTFQPHAAADAVVFMAARAGGTGEWQVTGVASGTGTLDALLKTSTGKGFTVFPTPDLQFVFLSDMEKPQPDVINTAVTVAAVSSETPRPIHPDRSETIFVQRPWLNAAFAGAHDQMEFKIATDAGLQQVVATQKVARLTNNFNNITYWQVPQTLTPGAKYYWSARALLNGQPTPFFEAVPFSIAAAADIRSQDGTSWRYPLPAAQKDLGISASFCEGYFHMGYRGRKLHAGVDWPVAKGTDVLAARSGVRGPLTGTGGLGDHGLALATFNAFRLIHLDASDNPAAESNYLHMNPLEGRLLPGTYVNQGTRVGQSSNFGTSALHLHFDVAEPGQIVFRNPLGTELQGWSRPSGGNPVILSAALRGGPLVDESPRTNLRGKIYVIVQASDPSGRFSAAPYLVSIRRKDNSELPRIQFDRMGETDVEAKFYAYQTQALADLPPSETQFRFDKSRGAMPYFYYAILDTTGRSSTLGPERLSIQATELATSQPAPGSPVYKVAFGPEIKAPATATVPSGTTKDIPFTVTCTNLNVGTAGDSYVFKLVAPDALGAKLIMRGPLGDTEVQGAVSFLSGQILNLRLRLAPLVGAPKGKFTAQVLAQSNELVPDIGHLVSIEVTVS